MFWGHADHPSPIVMTFPSSPTTDLLKITHRQQSHLLPIIFTESCKKNGTNGNIDPNPKGVRPANQSQITLLGHSLDKNSISGKHAGVMDADSMAKVFLQLLAVRARKTFLSDALGNTRLERLVCHLKAREALGVFRSLKLSEVHDVNRRTVLLKTLLNHLFQWVFSIGILQWNRPVRPMHPAGLLTG